MEYKVFTDDTFDLGRVFIAINYIVDNVEIVLME